MRYAPPAQAAVPLAPPIPVPPGDHRAEAVPPSRPPAGRRRALLVAVIAVFVLAAGAGGFALATSLNDHGQIAGQLPRPTTRVSSPTVRASFPPVPDSGTPSPSQPTQVPPTPTSTLTPPASPGTTVGVAAAVAASRAVPRVQALLDSYFTAINEHDYSQYSSLLDPQMQQDNPLPSFRTGYATTTDSAETITGISGTGDGGLAVTVTFTSNQNPADSPDNSSCTDWKITLYLIPQGSGYLIGPPPSTYSPSYQAC